MRPSSATYLAVPMLLTLAAAAPSALAAQAAAELSDAEIAHVAVTANAIDAEMAELAEDRASSDAVRQFARRMASDHLSVNERAAALAGRLGVTPANNEVSRRLRADAARVRAELERLRGGAFDRAYMDHEIAYHEAVLEALDGLLIPSTENDELRALLEEVRPIIASHRAHARNVRAGLGGYR